MKMSDLKNPAAAAAEIKALLKRFSTKTCLAPTNDCQGAIVAAHTLSAEAMLRPIAKDGQVYTIKTDLYNPTPLGPIFIGLQGVRCTSVFNGFCEKHDKVLFSPIEDQPFTCSNQQIFIHAFRAAAKEFYLKRKQAESIMSPDSFKEIHGLPKELELEFSKDTLLFQAASLRGAEEIERTKKIMDKHLISCDWRRIMTTVIPFAKTPTVVCNFVYSPDYDFEGNYLQDFENVEFDLSQLFVTIIPASTGGFALFSHLDTANAAPRRMIESLTDRLDITSSLLWLVFCQTENLSIAPGWYESLTSLETELINKAVLSNVNLSDVKHNQLRECNLAVGNWEPSKAFTL